MGFLTGKEVKARLLSIAYPEAVKGCEERRWGDLGNGLGIYPFEEEYLGPVTYDLTVGGESYSLRKAEKQVLSRENPLKIEPGETVLVLTEEYLVLTPKHTALVLARARIMDEGLSQTSARIDPTWYGKLIVPITNNTKTNITLRYRESFCTVVFVELDEPIPPNQYLSKKNLPFLGQTTLEYEPKHAIYWRPAKTDAVGWADLDQVVDLFGPPFDIVRGAIYRVKDDIIKWMEERWAPSALRDIKQSIWEGEIEALKKGRDEQRRTNYAIIGTLIFSVLGWLAAIFMLFVALYRGK